MAGVRVLDEGTFLAGPYAASILGEFGADVIKVKHSLGGDALRHFGTPTARGDTLTWLSEARNKRSVTINLHDADGVRLFTALVENSSATVSSTRPNQATGAVRDRVAATDRFKGKEHYS